MEINFNSKSPIYIQVMDSIKKEIASGILKNGDKLLSVRDMSQKIKVNPNTIQRAYNELEREEIAYTQRGMGTFVTRDSQKIKGIKKSMAFEIVNSFIKGMRSLGFSDEDIVQIIKESIMGEK